MELVSQHGIEKTLVALFGTSGYFVEIGCWDGELISQTAVIERMGWKGICIDPFPRNFDNRNCILVEKAISADGQSRQFMLVSIDRRYGGDVSYFSGFVDAIGKDANIMKLIQRHCDYTTITVETTTLSAVLEENNAPKFIEFLSIDTEGSEMEILKSIDFVAYKFGVIDVEHNRNLEVKNTIIFFLISNGYELLIEGEISDVFINESLL